MLSEQIARQMERVQKAEMNLFQKEKIYQDKLLQKQKAIQEEATAMIERTESEQLRIEEYRKLQEMFRKEFEK